MSKSCKCHNLYDSPHFSSPFFSSQTMETHSLLSHASLPSLNSSSNNYHGPNGPCPNPPTVTRPDPSNPYPTTFVQADTSSFKQVVQLLTGSTEPNHNSTPPIKPSTKLYERRNNSFKHHLRISLNSRMRPSHDGNTRRVLLSPSMLDSPSLTLSPVTPLIHDPFNRSPSCPPKIIVDKIAEEEAIAEKGFFLHLVSEPRLLPLFPVTSLKVSSSSSSSH